MTATDELARALTTLSEALGMTQDQRLRGAIAAASAHIVTAKQDIELDQRKRAAGGVEIRTKGPTHASD